MEVRRGDIFLAKIPLVGGHVENKDRPVLIIQNDKGNVFSPCIICALITSKPKKFLPTHVTLPCDGNEKKYNTIMTEQIMTLDKRHLVRKIDHLPTYYMNLVNIALKTSLNLEGE